MRSPKSLPNQTAETNQLKIKAIYGVSIIHTAFWMINIYSNQFYSLMVFLNSMIITIMHLEIKSLNLGQVMKAILFGVIPAIVFVYIPRYFFFAICSHFMSLTFGYNEITWKKMGYLCGSNIAGWTVGFLYYKHQINKNDSEMMVVEEIFRINHFLPFQIIIAFVIFYFVLGVTVINKVMEANLQQKYENELVQLNNELEVTNAKLKDSNKELQDALQEKENFILRFSHEIRNPLNSLLGSVELCCEQATEDKELNTLLHDAKVSGEILLQLLNNVLDTAKVSAGRLEVSFVMQNIRAFLERTWVICSEIIRKKRLYGSLSLNMNVHQFLEFDHHRVMQIFINLISNAAKFTESGHVKIYVDYIGDNNINGEDMLPKYSFLHQNDSSKVSGILDQEEINEKSQSIFEHLTLTSKRFRLGRNVLSKRANTEVEIPFTSNGSKEKGELEISSNKKIPMYSPSLEAPAKRFSNVLLKEDGYLRFEIIDTGCGIDKKEIDAAFGKFQQVNANSSKRQVGTGLGLWITKEIIEHMKGKIEMYSEPNKGTVVVIMIKSKFSTREPKKSPLKEHLNEGRSITEEEEKVNSQTRPLKKGSGSSTVGLKRALVVEDNPYNQAVNVKFLKKCNVQEITVANNGQEAVNVFLKMGQRYFDLVLMDIDMPIMDGKTAVKLIRQEEKRRGWLATNMVFLTAYSESKTQKQLLDPQGEYRANGFYSKPASLETVQRMINNVKISSDISERFFSIDNTPQAGESVILVADDDSFNLIMMTKMLRLYGYRTLEARNGEQAVQLYNENIKSVKLILMDCEMPVLNGLEATKKILSRPRPLERFSLGKTVVYGLTGNVGAEHRQRCLAAGMEGVLEKPIKIEKLREILKRHEGAS